MLRTPIVAVIIGEGGSGGALAIAVGDRVLMFEFSTYSVITPEGCAAILWRDASHRARAAEALKLTAPDLLGLGLVDEIDPRTARRRPRRPRRGRRRLARRAAPPPRRAVQGAAGEAHPPARREVPADGEVRGSLGVPQFVEVRFKGNRKQYYEWHDPEPLREREAVLVETDRGVDLGHVGALGRVAQVKCERCTGCAVAPAAGPAALPEGAPLPDEEGPDGAALVLTADDGAADVVAGPAAAERGAAAVRRVVRRASARRRPAGRRAAQRRGRRAADDPREGRRPPPADEGLGRGVAVGPQEAHGLLHGREARRLPEPRARAGVAVPHPHRAAADRGARRGRAARRHRALRAAPLLGQLPHRAAPDRAADRQGPAPQPEPLPDLGTVRPPPLLPALRARVLRPGPQALPQGGPDGADLPGRREGLQHRHLPGTGDAPGRGRHLPHGAAGGAAVRRRARRAGRPACGARPRAGGRATGGPGGPSPAARLAPSVAPRRRARRRSGAGPPRPLRRPPPDPSAAPATPPAGEAAGPAPRRRRRRRGRRRPPPASP